MGHELSIQDVSLSFTSTTYFGLFSTHTLLDAQYICNCESF